MTTFYGQWDKLSNWFKSIHVRVSSAALAPYLSDLGRVITDRVTDHIRNQSLPWKPLKGSTVQRKGHELVYLDQWEYVRSIRAEVSKMGMFAATLKVRLEGEHSSGITMNELGYYLEYGTASIEARPLWRPVFVEVVHNKRFRPLADLLRTLEFSHA